MLFSFAALVGFITLMYALYPTTEPARSSVINILAAAGLAAIAVTWLLTRSARAISPTSLSAIDAAATIIIGITFAASALLSQDKVANIYSSFIWVSFAIFARSLIIPSAGRRTLVISTLGLVPMITVVPFIDAGVPRPAFIAGLAIFCVVAVILSTIGSDVIYGLRARVTKAMQLGQYSLEEKIGQGGMGEVYRARHMMLRRPTAVKLLRPERTGVEALQRFEREVQLTSELTHPNTVAIYDYGRSPQGVFYYAMEYLDGVDLETLVAKSGPQPAARTVHILIQVCGALREAHARGLVHRDIKPGNIILCKRGGLFDVAKVVDFGLVKEIKTDENLTNVDHIVGTPGYLAPEMVTSPELIGTQSDLYALGGVGYFLLTGKTMFEASTVVEMCMHQVTTTPERPEQRVDNEIPNELSELIMRCLEKAPDKRPAGADALRDALLALPEASEWNEVQAREAWTALDIRRSGKVASPVPSGFEATINIDISDRVPAVRDTLRD